MYHVLHARRIENFQLTVGKLWQFPLVLEPYFFEDKNEINGFKGKDAVAPGFICSRSRIFKRIASESHVQFVFALIRAMRSWKIFFNWQLSSETSMQPVFFSILTSHCFELGIFAGHFVSNASIADFSFLFCFVLFFSTNVRYCCYRLDFIAQKKMES